MSPLITHGRKREFIGRALLSAVLCFIGAACSTTPPAAKILFEDPHGAVFLQQIQDRSFNSSHPVHLEPALIARLLSGVLVQERQRVLQTLAAGPSSPIPVFSAEEIQFLAPLLANALAAASPDQVVGFLLTRPRPGASSLEYSATETTAGSLYAYGASLGVSLSQYRNVPTRTGTENIARRRLPDSSGLSDRVLLFSPAQAQRSDNMLRPPAGVASDKFLGIDYRLLQQLSPSTAAPEQAMDRQESMARPVREDAAAIPRSGSQSDSTRTLNQREEEIQALKDLVIKKDLELESLRKELQSVRKQLDSQTSKQDTQKQKNKPPSKPQQTIP